MPALPVEPVIFPPSYQGQDGLRETNVLCPGPQVSSGLKQHPLVENPSSSRIAVRSHLPPSLRAVRTVYSSGIRRDLRTLTVDAVSVLPARNRGAVYVYVTIAARRGNRFGISADRGLQERRIVFLQPAVHG